MSERFQLEYEVSVTGLGETVIAADTAGKSAEQASNAINNVRMGASRTLPTLMMSIRAVNATRLAVEQTSKAISDLDPRAALYAFLNMMQVVRNLTSLMSMLKESTGAASAAQAILATLTGRWWLIPLAIAAGALIYSRIRSMQLGGLVPETGVYLLHSGEHVIPKEETHIMKTFETTNIHTTHRSLYTAPERHVHSYGPIFVSFERQPREGPNIDDWLRSLSGRIAQLVRRGG